MRRLLYVTTLLCCWALPAHSAVYKHIDAKGNVYYSDTQPVTGEQPLKLKAITTVTLPKAAPSEKAPGKLELAHEYNAIAISAPSNEDTIRNVSFYYVSVSLDPELMKQDQIVIFDNGKEVGRSTHFLSFQVSALERGTHTLLAQIRDPRDQILKSSSPITVYVQRHSILLGPGSHRPPEPPPTPVPTPPPTPIPPPATKVMPPVTNPTTID